jgi:hypothetical protein
MAGWSGAHFRPGVHDRVVVRDDFWVQKQRGDLYGPSLLMDFPSEWAQGRAFNRVERAVERLPDLLAGAVWDPAASRIHIRAVPAGVKRANKIAARLAAAGVAEEIVVDHVRHSSSALRALHVRVIEDLWGWLGKYASSATGSEEDPRVNAVIVDVEDPISEEMIEITQARWGRDVRLRFAPGSRMILQ